MKENDSYGESNGAKKDEYLDDLLDREEDSVQEVKWDGSESELISDEEDDGYEENKTGVKIKYTLSESEVSKFLKHTDGYKKNGILQRNHTIIQAVIFLILVTLWIYMGSIYYVLLTIFPILSVVVLWTIPIISTKKLSKKFCSGEEVSAEIFPDKINIKVKDVEKEIPLDGDCECEETAGIIIVYPKASETIMIPIRAIEPEFIPDVQAMIFAGSQPRYQN